MPVRWWRRRPWSPRGWWVPPGSLVAGVPAKVRRELTAEEREHIKVNAAMYTELAQQHRASVTPES